MSQETPLNSLGGNKMNSEDSRLVDSILNDLNSTKPQQSGPQQSGPQQQMPQRGQAPQQMSPEQHKALLAQRQHQMMQQQQMLQNQVPQKIQEVSSNENESLLDKLQKDAKYIIIVISLSIIANISVVDELFKMEGVTYFMQDNGNLNIQATIIKAIVVGVIFFICKNFLPLD